MEINKNAYFVLWILLGFLFISGNSSASEKVSFNFSGKTHIIFGEPTAEELATNSGITANLYGDNIQLVPNYYWITKRVDNDHYDISYKDWTNFFLRIDKVNSLVYKVSGQIGGSNNVVGQPIPDIQVRLNSKYQTVSLYFESAYLELNTKTSKAEFKIGDLIYLDSNTWEVNQSDDQVFHIRQRSFWPRIFWKVDLKRNKFYFVSDENFDAPVANEMNAKLSEIQFASGAIDSAKSNSPKGPARNELDLVEAVKKFPDYWQSYLDLGRYYIVRGEFKKAADIYAQYPPFKDEQKGNRIVVSNEAATAGFDLYYVGAVSEARPFFKIAANSGTGSAATMNCEAFLLMADGKYAEASATFYRLAKAYDQRVGYTHSLSLLNLLNQQKTAWDVFNTLNLAEYTPTILNSAFVAHRRERKKAEEMIPWLLEGNRATLSLNDVDSYFLMQTMVDRIPNKSTLKNLAELEKRKQSVMKEGASNESMLGWFASGYVDLRNHDYAASYNSFSQRVDLIKNNAAPYRFVLPYFVWSGIQTSHASDVKQMLDYFAMQQNDTFDYHLAAALVFYYFKDNKSTKDHLNLASYRVSSASRPFSPWFQLIEACEWLYESSHNPEYRDLMVSFAKRYQQIYPMYSWAYAVEAKYTQSSDDRTKALAMAQYLDPSSQWISHFTASDKKKALTWFKDHNPFNVKDVKEAPQSKVEPSRQI